MKAVVKKPEYPFHPWLIKLAGQEIDVEKNEAGFYRQVRIDGEPGFIFSASELTFNDALAAA